MFARESMWDTMNYLANTEQVMFTENKGYSHKTENSLAIYGNKTIKRCEELFGHIEDIEEKMNTFDWPISKIKKSPKTYIQ